MNNPLRVKGEERQPDELSLKRSISHDHMGSLSESAKKLQRCKSEETIFSPKTPSKVMSTTNALSHLGNPSNSSNHHYNSSGHHSSTGHRPVTSCTHCRQHKIRCNASDNFPAPCSRCEKMSLSCQIDPQFRPKKGSQLQNLRRDVDELKLKIEYLTRNESLIARALQQSSMGQELINTLKSIDVMKVGELTNTQAPQKLQQRPLRINPRHDKVSVQTYLASEPHLLQADLEDESNKSNSVYKKDIPLVLQMALQGNRTGLGGMGSSAENRPVGVNNNSNIDTPRSQRISPSLSPTASTYSTSKRRRTGSITAASQDNAPLLIGNDKDSKTNINYDSVSHNPSCDADTSRCDQDQRNGQNGDSVGRRPPVIATTNAIPLLPSSYAGIDEFVIGDVRISIEKANELHQRFVTRFLPYFPIMYTNSATELYSQSQLLFWTVMLTACLSDLEPSMYIKLASLIKQLAIETCWIRTPRSAHIIQALLILCIWPLPNLKVLDDCSYRFVGLAKSLSYQLGLHRGEFISEFTRTQTSMPDAEKWRTRTWLGTFFAEVCWASVLGLPPTSETDYLVEDARMGVDEDEVSPMSMKEGALSPDTSNNEQFESCNCSIKDDGNNNHNNRHHQNKKRTKLPRNFRRLVSLAYFQAKLCKLMGSSVATPDGLIEPADRANSLAVLNEELETLDRTLDFGQDTTVCIYYLYVKLMVCCFAFLPGTPIEVQSQYVTEAYLSATKIVTLLVTLLEKQQLVELPIYIRQSATYAAFILFKLQLTPLFLNRYLDSARQSIVTVHRLFRNQLSAWATTVENDISRTASVLEKLNFVLITHPTVFVEEDGIISRMRSHLTGSLFYDLVWCVHEARRREMDPRHTKNAMEKATAKPKIGGDDSSFAAPNRRLYPLPFYNQISREDFETIIQTTPSGTTVSTLVPTKAALNNAKSLAEKRKDSDGSILQINGIPLSMLDETGSLSWEHILGSSPTTGSAAASLQPMVSIPSSRFPTDPLTQSLDLEAPLYPNSTKRTTSINESGIPTIPPFMNESQMQRSISTPVIQTGAVTNTIQSAGPATAPSGPIHQGANNNSSLFSIHNSSFPSSLNKFPCPSNRTSTLIQDRNSPKINSNETSSPNPSTNLLNGNVTQKVNLDGYSNLNLFLNSNHTMPTVNSNGSSDIPNEQSNTGRNSINPLSELDMFFQQQSTGWLEGNSSNDDFLGWFDMDMEPNF